MHTSWERAWGGLRVRRVSAALAGVAFVVVACLPSIPALLAGTGVLFLALFALRAWPCPRCGQQFAGVHPRLFAPACAACGLPEFAPVEELTSPPPALADARRLPVRVRRFVAGALAGGGGVVVLLSGLAALPGPYGWLVELLGAAGVAAGVWLWRDEARGYRLARGLLALQVAQLQLPPVAFVLSLGPEVLVTAGASPSGLRVGFYGTCTALYGVRGPNAVAINLFALAALLLLLRARPTGAAAVPASGPVAQAA